MGVEYSDGEFVGAQVLSDVFHGVELRRIGRQIQERDVIRHPWIFCVMPSRFIHDQTGHARRWPRFWRSLRGAIPSLRYWRMARSALRLFRVPDRSRRRYSSICSAYREGCAGVSRALPGCGSASLVDQPLPRPGTISPKAFSSPGLAGFPQPERQGFPLSFEFVGIFCRLL